MKWKTKARIQNFIDKFPTPISLRMYYLLQTRFGKLASSKPSVKFEKAVAMVRLLEAENRSVSGSTIFELGTGYRLNVPIALWMMGARKIYTVDLNPYLKWELIQGDLD